MICGVHWRGCYEVRGREKLSGAGGTQGLSAGLSSLRASSGASAPVSGGRCNYAAGSRATEVQEWEPWARRAAIPDFWGAKKSMAYRTWAELSGR